MTSTNNREIKFLGSSGDKLSARLDLPDSQPIAYAIFAHCFTCSKDLFASARISTALANLGIGVLRFDFTGLGSSEGEFANTNFSSNVADLIHAAEFLRNEFEAPRIMIGHSLGGAAVIAAASDIPETVAIATIGAPSDPENVIKHFGASIEKINEEGEAEVTLAGRTFKIQKQFLDDIAEQKLTSTLRTFNKALLVFHSPQDETVDIDHARKLYEAAKHPKSFISLDKADHLLTNKSDSQYVANVLCAWVSRYIY